MPETEMVQLQQKQRMTSELTARFENIETYEIDYSLAWKWKMETYDVDTDTGLMICNASHENIFLGEPKRFR